MERKTLFIMCGSVIAVLLVLLLGLWIATLFSDHYYSYEEAEEKIAEATEKYYRDNPLYLPTDDGKYNLSYSALVNAEYIKPLGELIEGGDTCSATITVIKKEEAFTYIPYLNCGDAYSTRDLATQVIQDNPVTKEGNGLYQDDKGTYYFKGKVSNNYVALGTYESRGENVSYLWRIISIENNQVKLKAVNHTEDRIYWDNRYNTTEQKTTGYNDFDLSTLSEYLKKLETKNDIFTEKEMTKLEPVNLCIGKRELTDNISKGNLECTKLSKNQYLFGTITPYEYMRASGDAECTSAKTKACLNFNYLAESNHSNDWLITTTASNNYQAYVFEGRGFRLNEAYSNKYVFPTIVLNEFSFVKSGNGTKEDPYMIK